MLALLCGGVFCMVLICGVIGKQLLHLREQRLVRDYINMRDLYYLARGRGDVDLAVVYLDQMNEIEHQLYGKAKYTPSRTASARYVQTAPMMVKA